MNILLKCKETAVSVIPVMIIVVLLGTTVAPLGTQLLFRFIIGGILLIIGLTIFLLGVDIGIQPIGEQCGVALTKKKSLSLLLIASFIIGFLVTAAEPDIQVFSNQVKSMYQLVDKQVLIFMIAAGVGLFMVVGLLRTIVGIPLTPVLWICYVLIFVLTVLVPSGFVGIAFDSGGATTGPMTVPFIMALGIGVSRVRVSSNNDSFGLTGLASIGPVLAVLLYGFLLSNHIQTDGQSAAVVSEAEIAGLGVFIQQIPSIMHEAAFSLLPLVALFIVFQLCLLHLPLFQVFRIAMGLIYSYIGLVVFLTGVNGGFMLAGGTLGALLGANAVQYGGWWFLLLLGTGFVLGAVVVIAEPAVWVLTEQVESISGGTIKRKIMLLFLSVGAAVAIGLALFRTVTSCNIMYILLPGYIVALLLTCICPPLFTGIAFDSGGVASGPISSTFILSFTLGAASATGSNGDAFGVIALIAMTPLIAIQVLGLVFTKKRKVQ
ncbi:MAG: DUF1538 domain-containing protein [Treponema sp.]|nr:DUF1538 domain-containing protein [Treponema sp.]